MSEEEKNEDFINRMEEQYYQQTRNGRQEVYIDADDLNKLGYGIDKNKTGRVYVDARYFKLALNRYKFKDGLKVEVKQQTFKELEKEIKKIEREK